MPVLSCDYNTALFACVHNHTYDTLCPQVSALELAAAGGQLLCLKQLS